MIEANFNEGKNYVQTEAIWQYDRGVKLLVKGLSGLDEDTEFHFETVKGKTAVVKKGVYSVEDNSVTVDVPAAFIEHTDGVPKKVWVYLSQGDSQFTCAKILVPVFCRQCPDDYITQDDLSEDTAIERAVDRYFSSHTSIIAGKEDKVNKKSQITSQPQPDDAEISYPTVGAVRSFIGEKADKALTLEGYGIINAYTKAEIDEMFEQADSTVQLVPEFAQTISECTDTSKLYVLPDGFIYAYMYGEEQPENILETNTVYLNQRKNSSNNLTVANGYITTDLIPAADGDIIRFNRATVLNGSYCRMKFFDRNGNRVILGGDDWNLNKEFKIETDSDGYPYIRVGYYNSTSGNDSSNRRDPSRQPRLRRFMLICKSHHRK